MRPPPWQILPRPISPPTQQPVTANQPATSSSNRKACLAVLSSTNLNVLFRMNMSIMGTSLSSLASSTTTASATTRPRVRGVLERSGGDYSRFLPHHVGVRIATAQEHLASPHSPYRVPCPRDATRHLPRAAPRCNECPNMLIDL